MEEVAGALESAIPGLMERAGVPGLSITLVRDGAIAWSRGFGVERIGGAPVTRDTRFEVASNGKVVAALAALILVEEGALSLDAPMSTYLETPYLPPSEHANAVSLRRVLSHTSGMSNVVFWKHTDIAFPPGERFSYSGAGFGYLQAVIEAVGRRPFDALVRERVFDPLGMASSSYAPTPDLATGHVPLWIVAAVLAALATIPAMLWLLIRSWRDRRTRWRAIGAAGLAFALVVGLARNQPVPIPKRETPAHAAWSLRSTAGDLARLLIELARPTLVTPETNAAMRTPQVRVNDRVSWGLGIGIQHGDDADTLWHWGLNPGYESLMVLHPDTATGVVILTNATGGITIVREIAHLATGGEHYGYWNFADP